MGGGVIYELARVLDITIIGKVCTSQIQTGSSNNLVRGWDGHSHREWPLHVPGGTSLPVCKHSPEFMNMLRSANRLKGNKESKSVRITE
jgi:hypothetical protein